MRIIRGVLVWPAATAAAVAAGWVAVAAAGTGPDVLSEQDVRERLAAAQPSASDRIEREQPLADGEWNGLLPSAGIVARCADGSIHLVRWSGSGTRDVQAGPAATVSGTVLIDQERVTFTARCVDGLPTGTYRWTHTRDHPADEPEEHIVFGRWVDMPHCDSPCARPSIKVLSPAPNSGRRQA